MEQPGTLPVIKVHACSRCGLDHDGVAFRAMARAMAPPESAPLQWTHWAPCPTNGDPIMLMVVDDEALEAARDRACANIEAGDRWRAAVCPPGEIV